MKILEEYYEAGEDGTIKKMYKFNGEELATKSDVYEWHIKGKAYTDNCYICSRVAIGISIVCMVISIIFSFICMVS